MVSTLGLPIRTSHAVSSTTVEPVALETSLPPQLGPVVPMDYERVHQEQKEEEENRQAEIAESNQNSALLSVDGADTKTQTLSMNMQIAPTTKSPSKTESSKRSVPLPPKVVFKKECDNKKEDRALPMIPHHNSSNLPMEEAKTVELGTLEARILSQLGPLFEGEGFHKMINTQFITNLDRAFGTRISYEISKRYNEAGLDGKRKLTLNLIGQAGQLFCASLSKGVHVSLEGVASDFVGKGLSGGTIHVYSPKHAGYKLGTGNIVGHDVLYGAIHGDCMFGGVAGDRFAVRNSGANVIVEAVGVNGCGFMTGGKVIVLGMIGRNFAASMSGGIVYLFNQGKNFEKLINSSTVDISKTNDEDVEYIFKQISSFVAITGSELGKRIIDNWIHERMKLITISAKDFEKEKKEKEKRQAEIAKFNREVALLPVYGAHTRTQTSSMDMQIAPTLNSSPKSTQNPRLPIAPKVVVKQAGDSKLIVDRRRGISKSLRPQDMAGFKNEEDLQQAIDFEEEDEMKSEIEEHSDEEKFQMNKKMSTDIESVGIPAHLQKKEPLDKLRESGNVNVKDKKISRVAKEQFLDKVREQAARCVNCGVPFGQGCCECPLGTFIPKFNDVMVDDFFKKTFEEISRVHCFPEFNAGLFSLSEEDSCCLGTGFPAVTRKSIECAIIDYAFMQGWVKPQKPTFNTGKRIAIIGSGPSGLAAAAELTKVGHSVCVYERKNRCGGLLNGQVHESVIDRRLSLLEQEGVRFLTNIEIGKEVSANFMHKDNDAIIVCTGSTTARDLTVEGRDAKGICFAMEFLEKSQRRRDGDVIAWEGLDPTGKKVIVLGDGDTATDCIAKGKIFGCKTVGAFEILSQPSEGREPEHPLPECPLIFRTDYEHEEAKVLTGSDPRTYSVSIKRFLTTTNSAGVKVLTGLEIVNVEWEKDEKGAWKLVEKTDTLRVIEADLCILAMGFVGPEKTVIDQLNLKTDPRSNILTSKDKYDSAVAKVFAAGDCRRGGSSVVWAIHEGRQAARQVDDYLMGNTTLAGLGGNVTSNIVHK